MGLYSVGSFMRLRWALRVSVGLLGVSPCHRLFTSLLLLLLNCTGLLEKGPTKSSEREAEMAKRKAEAAEKEVDRNAFESEEDSVGSSNNEEEEEEEEEEGIGERAGLGKRTVRALRRNK